jgi:hypothetical protein
MRPFTTCFRGFRALLSLLVPLASGSALASTAVTLTEDNAAAGAWAFAMGAPIPTLAEWAMIVLLVAMGALALWQLRKRPGFAGAGLALLTLTLTGALVAGIATSPLGVAGHEPGAEVNGQTMRSPLIPGAGTTSVQIVAQLEADPGDTITGMTLHYQKTGDPSWQTVAGAVWGLPTCTNCWAADLPLVGYTETDPIRYFVSAAFATAGDAYLFDGESPANACSGVDCGAKGECLDGACVCDEGYHGDACELSCSDGAKNGAEEGEDCGGPCATFCCPSGTEMTPNGDTSGLTLTDPATCLVWQKTPSAHRNHGDAITYCANNTGGLPGVDWRLPTVTELRSLIRGCPATEEPDGSCNIDVEDCLSYGCIDASCIGCSAMAGPAGGCYWDASLQGNCGLYWSSSPHTDNPYRPWGANFSNSSVYTDDVTSVTGVRCVRTGP